MLFRSLEEAGRQFGAELGLDLAIGTPFSTDDARALSARMADKLFEAMKGGSPKVGATSLLRLDPIAYRGPVGPVTISGGVSEFVYGREKGRFGDLGPYLAIEIRNRIVEWGKNLERPAEGIRATVIGASQFTVQVSGKTIYLPKDQKGVLPVHNIPVVQIGMDLSDAIAAPDIDRKSTRLNSSHT